MSSIYFPPKIYLAVNNIFLFESDFSWKLNKFYGSFFKETLHGTKPAIKSVI
jgi:hypothetical protein